MGQENGSAAGLKVIAQGAADMDVLALTRRQVGDENDVRCRRRTELPDGVAGCIDFFDVCPVPEFAKVRQIPRARERR